VHSNICGPMKFVSIGGSHYFITFINDFLCNSWVYFMRKKSDVLEFFKIFIALVERISRKEVKALRRDNGGDIVLRSSRDFANIMVIQGRRLLHILLSENGVAKLLNRTLMEKAWSMKVDVGLSKRFWVATISTMNYLTNRSPSSVLGDKTLKEVVSEEDPLISHLRVFGCEVYMHVPKVNRIKLDNKSTKCIFIGYSKGAKGYKL
jgi:hypothetical protein